MKWRNTTEHTVPHRQSTAANKYGFGHCGSALLQLRMTFSHVIDHISFMSKCLVSQRCMHSAIKSFWVLPLLCDFHLNSKKIETFLVFVQRLAFSHLMFVQLQKEKN